MLGLHLLIAAKRKLGSERVKGFLRVFVYAVVVCAGLFFYSYRSAKADIGKSSMQIGRDLAEVADLLEETTEVHLNGEPVWVASAVTREPMHDVLDRFEKHCSSSPGALGGVWKDLAALKTAEANAAKKPDTEASAGPLKSAGVIRQEARREGVVLCLLRGSETQGTLREAAHAFSQTHDLGTFGKLRYAYTTVTEQGNTMVLTVWTEDKFHLGALFPAEGDAPGKDPEGIPRPPDSRRLMSIDIAKSPFGTHVYRSTQSPEQLLKYYDAQMDEKGWIVIDPTPNDGTPGRGRSYMKDGVQYVVASGKDDSGSTILSIGEMAARPRTAPR